MHYRCVCYVIGSFLLVLGAVMVVPLVVAFVADDAHLDLEHYEVLGIFGGMAAAVLLGMLLRALCETDLAGLRHREGAAIVAFTWIAFSFIGGLPYVFSGTMGFTDAFFETMSGFTTTGATVVDDIEALPRGLLLWRCQTQWLGGMGIVVLSVAVLPLLGIGSYRMFKAEAPGGATFQRNAPQIKQTAKVLWLTYVAMSLVEALLLRAGGMTTFEAVCHTFTTMSTGGFSTSGASIAHWPSPYIQWVISAFMLAAGANFGLYELVVRRRPRRALRDPEMHTYTAIAIGAGLVIAAVLLARGLAQGLEHAARAGIFQSLTILTTTGYGTEDFDRWPDSLRLLLLLLMFVGGCAGSTAGGPKVIRWLVMVKAVLADLRRAVSPRAVLVVRVGDRAIERPAVANIMAFFSLYLLVFTAATYALTLLGLDLLTATSAAATNLANVGPGLGEVGPTRSFSAVPATGKWILSACMLLGRLELYTVVVLLLPRTWRR